MYSREINNDEKEKINTIIDSILTEIPTIDPNDPEREIKIFTYIYTRLSGSIIYDDEAAGILDQLHKLGGFNRERFEDTHPIDPRIYDARAILCGKALCSGFADILQIALERTGIKSIKIHGISADGKHVWNQVCLDGQWYNCDLTNDYEFVLEGMECNYFLKSDAEFPNNNKYKIDTERTPEVHKCNISVSSKHQEELLNNSKTIVLQVSPKQKEEKNIIQNNSMPIKNKFASFIDSILEFIKSGLRKMKESTNEYEK